MSSFTFIHRLTMFALLAGLAGCTVHPPGEREERDAALQSGKPFEKRIEARQIPPLPENPTPDQLVEYALLNNAELEQHYWEWRSAIEQIPQDGTQSTTLNVAAGTSITNGRASWGSSTVALSNDPMTDIKWPGKLDAAARQTLENASAAGRRFIKAKYDLRNKVLSAYYDYALNAELIRLEQSNQQLLRDDRDGHRSPKPCRQFRPARRPESQQRSGYVRQRHRQHGIAVAEPAGGDQRASESSGGCAVARADRTAASAINGVCSDGELVDLAAKAEPGTHRPRR